MLKLNLVLVLLFVNVSVFADERVAPVTCAVISETTLDQSAYRVKEVNEARTKLNLDPYLEGDDEILLSINNDLCILLIMDFEEYKKQSKILILAEKEEVERRRKVREKAQEELRREIESTLRKENEENKTTRAIEEQEKTNDVLQQLTKIRRELDSAFESCKLPHESTKVSMEKVTDTLSFSIFMEFSEVVSASCPALISGSQDLKGKYGRNNTPGDHDKYTERSGWNNPELVQTTKDKLSTSSVIDFYFEAKIDGFKDNIIMNGSYMNGHPVFNIEYNSTKNTLLRGDIRFVTKVGIDATIDFNQSPYSYDYDLRSGKWKQPTFITKKNLKKLNVGMISEVSLVGIVEASSSWLKPPKKTDSFEFKKVLYSRGI
jgi:hypothetical protein